MANANADAMMQADLAKLPVFKGDKLDPFTAEQWIDRIYQAKTNSDWNDPRALMYMKNALRGPALTWFENLPISIGKTAAANFDQVRKTFLHTYSKVRTARTATTNLAEVKQGNSESVNDYYNRVLSAINDLHQLMPAAALIREPTADAFADAIKDLAGFGALANGPKHATLDRAMQLGAEQAFHYVALQHFIANLKPAYRDELMKTAPATLYSAFKAAAELEGIQATPHRFTTGAVAELQNEEDAFDNTDDLDQEIEAINMKLRSLTNRRAQRGASRGRGSTRGRGANRGTRGNRGGATNSGSAMQCWYCKKNGHHQDDCYSRINAGAPKVNRSGKPNVNESETVERTPAPATQPQVIYAWPPGAQSFNTPGQFNQGPPQGSNYEYLSPIQHPAGPSVTSHNPVFY